MIRYVLISLALSVSLLGVSQDGDSYVYGDSSPKKSKAKSSKKGKFDWSRVAIGGGFGLQFGDNTLVAIAPTFGYYLTDDLIVGVGGNYTYEDNKIYAYEATTYGGNIFSQYLFPRIPLMAHAELESANINVDYAGNVYENTTFNLINVYVGGGLKQRMGRHSYFYVLGLWNLNETKESNYIQPNPVIRIGIAVGL